MSSTNYSSFSRVTRKVNGLSPLQRRVPRNPKYAGVKSSLDTGNSMSKVDLISQREHLRRRDEIFSRVRPSTVAELIEENAVPSESIFTIAEEGSGSVTDEAFDSENKAMANSSYFGGDATPVKKSTTDATDSPMKPYLILDVRDRELYSACHIGEARSYPSEWLRHDKITPDLHRYKNRRGCVIIIYDNDGKAAAKTTTVFVEKGYENVFLMSGGLYAFGKHFPNLCKGTPPNRAEDIAKLQEMEAQAMDNKRASKSRPPLPPGRRQRLTKEALASRDDGGQRKFKADEASTMSRTESLLAWKPKMPGYNTRR